MAKGDDIYAKEKIENGFKGVIAYYYNVGKERDVVKAYCARRRYYVKGRYYDNDRSEYWRLLTQVKVKGEIVVVYYNERNYAEMEFCYLTLMSRGAKSVEFVDGFMIPANIEYIARRQREYLSKKVNEGREDFVASGKSFFTMIPYGYYRYHKKIFVDEYESFIVKFVYYRRNQGIGYKKIAKELRDRGFKNRRDKPISSDTVRTILKNQRIYEGYCTYKGVEYKGDHTPLIFDGKPSDKWEWVMKRQRKLHESN